MRIAMILAAAALFMTVPACDRTSIDGKTEPDTTPKVSKDVEAQYRATYDRNSDGKDDNTGEMITAALVGYAIAGGFNGGGYQTVNHYYRNEPKTVYYRRAPAYRSAPKTYPKAYASASKSSAQAVHHSRPASSYKSRTSTHRSSYRSRR